MQAYTSPGRFLEDRRIILWCLGVVVAAGLILTGFFYNRNEIRIYADGKEIDLIMRGGTVADAIRKARLPVGENDIVEPPEQTVIKDDIKILITRRINVTVVADGKTVEELVPVGTVEQALKNLKIALNPGDQVIPELGKRISAGEIIEVFRFREESVTETVKIPFKVERRSDRSMEKGRTRIVREGREGLLQRTVKITLKNGKVISREVIAEKTLRTPVNKVVAIGTVNVKTVSRGGTIRFSRVLTVTATAYTHTGRRTAAGVYPYRGIVAVDPGVIPLGTKVYIDGYGYATAMDIGSAIRGNKIDVFMDTEKEARKWGRRSVRLYILEED